MTGVLALPSPAQLTLDGETVVKTTNCIERPLSSCPPLNRFLPQAIGIKKHYLQVVKPNFKSLSLPFQP